MRALSLNETIEDCISLLASHQKPHRGCRTFSSQRELSDLVAYIVQAMRGSGYGNGDLLAISLAFEEVAPLGMAEGRGRARVRWAVSSAAVTVVIEEEALAVGASPASKPPLRDRLEQSSAGGVLAILACMNWVHFPRRGNCIAMGRKRTA